MAKPDQDVRNRKLNPEARMELKEHLREFRDRFIKAAIATAIAAVLSVIFLYQPFIDAISEPQIGLTTDGSSWSLSNVSSDYHVVRIVDTILRTLVESPLLYGSARLDYTGLPSGSYLIILDGPNQPSQIIKVHK